MHMRFPEQGQDQAEVLRMLDAMKADDADWQGGRVPLFVFKGSDAASDIARDAFFKYFTENALGRARAFPSLQRMEDEIIAMALDLFHAPADANGFVTTGGSESIIQAVQTCRDYNRARRGDDSHRGNIVIPVSGHPAFDKAARLMDLEVRRVPVAEDFRGDVAAMAAAIDDDTIMLVGSAPCFPFGVFDPIEALADIARRHDTWLHVDACVGGYFAPFATASGRAIPAFDLGVAGVCSMSADLHKFGYAPKPISTLFYSAPQYAGHHGFEFHDWPNGRFATTTIVGTRAGGAIAGAWALFQHLGRDGYTAIADQLLTGIEQLRAGVADIPGLTVLGRPELSIVAIGGDGLDIFRVAEHMRDKGWVPGLLQEPKALHRMMSMLHVASMPAYLDDLTAATEATRSERSDASELRAEY
ncbi:MAG: pyridoxal phosphate-dependent decarboxylase family protein [Hyphomicrobiaceae bacterium]